MSRRERRRGRGQRIQGAESGAPRAGRTDRREPAGHPGRRRRRLRIGVVTAAAVAIAFAAWLVMRPRLSGHARTPDPAATMTPQEAYETALRLSSAGHHGESLRYYQRAITGPGQPQNPWPIHFNYGAALYNVGLEVRDRGGIAVPVVRSSIERVALMREAITELDLAEQLARSPADRASVRRARAERFQVWGFPWEAFVLMRQAQWTDSTQRQLSRIADGYMLVLEHPERRWTAADSTARR